MAQRFVNWREAMVGLSILLLLLRNFAGIYAGEWDTGAAPIDSYTTETKFGYSVAISDTG